MKLLLQQQLQRAILDFAQGWGNGDRVRDLAFDQPLIFHRLRGKVVTDSPSPCLFVYRCAIAFPLAPILSLSPFVTAQGLITNLPPDEGIRAYLTPPAWLDFEISDRTLARELQHLLDSPLPKLPPEPPPLHLFPFHYAHTRCYSRLRLAREQGWIDVNLEGNDLHWYSSPPFADPSLTFRDPWEQELIACYFDGVKARLLLGALFAFDQHCRIWGGVYPALALGRLGLLAIGLKFLRCLLLEHGHTQPWPEL